MTTIVQMTPEVPSVVTDSLVAGLLEYLRSDPNSATFKGERLQLILLIISIGSAHASSLRFAFECALLLISESPESTVNADNFAECVDMLISFVLVGAGSSSFQEGQKLSPLQTTLQLSKR